MLFVVSLMINRNLEKLIKEIRDNPNAELVGEAMSELRIMKKEVSWGWIDGHSLWQVVWI